MSLPPTARRLLAALLVAAGLASLALAATRPRPNGRLFEDERIFSGSAAGLLRHGVLAFSPPGPQPPAPSANREPGYSVLIAAAWWLAGAPAPTSDEEVARLPESRRLYPPLRALHALLLAVAAVAAALGVARLAGALAGAVAFLFVASSPALQANLSQLMSENLAAAHLAVAGLCLLGLARRERWAPVATAVVVGLAPLVRAEAILLLPVALLVAGVAGRGGRWPERRRALGLLALGLALPTALWLARNGARTGHATLSERGGLALAVRAAIDAEVERFGALSAALAWTPLERAHAASRALAPEATWLDYRPEGPGNFYLRTFRRWHEDRSRPGADPVAIDAAMGRAALARFARSPWAHLRAAAAVAVRGLFSEAAPTWAHPFDLRFGLGLLLAAGSAVATWRAARRRELAALAFLAPAWVLFGFHAAATELLPRYAVPLLPLAWAALALAIASPRRGSDAG